MEKEQVSMVGEDINYRGNSRTGQKLKAYIAGKVNGLPMDAVRAKFNAKHRELAEKGYEVINPVHRIANVNLARVGLDFEPLKDDLNRKEIMGICLYDLSTCDEIHLLHDWTESEGVAFEVGFARRFGIKVIHP